MGFLEPHARSKLTREGFVLLEKLLPDLSTLDVGHRFGSVLDIEKLLPSTGIPTVQSLKPRTTAEVKQNQYSGHYGLDSLPLHTDLAHWALPPRYFLLRCVVGTGDVFTNLLPCAYVVDLVGKDTLEKAVLRIRKRRHGYSGLVRALSLYQKEQVFRWDSVFLQPLNKHAHALEGIMLDLASCKAVTKIRLEQRGDTVLIDNWRMLHGRSSVPSQSIGRHIERVYLSGVFNDC